MLRFLLPDRCLRIADLHKKPEYRVPLDVSGNGTLSTKRTVMLMTPDKQHAMVERERAKRAKYPRC